MGQQGTALMERRLEAAVQDRLVVEVPGLGNHKSLGGDSVGLGQGSQDSLEDN